MRLLILLIFTTETYKLIYKNNSWDYCYKNNIVYSYSDFIKIDSKDFSLFYMVNILLLLYIFYFILLIQLFLTLLMLILVQFDFVIKKGDMLFNIFLYIPFLNAYCIKRLYKRIFLNKRTFRVFILNLITIKMWGFPRITISYSFSALKIIKAFERDPDPFNFLTFIDILKYIYDDTYAGYIKKIEDIIWNTLL